MGVETPSKKRRVRPRTEARRAQGRLHQARYRKKQKALALSLEQDVPRLQRLVERLEHHCVTLHNVVATRHNAQRLVLWILDSYRCGIDVASAPVEGRIAYLQSVFHENVRLGDSYGFDYFIWQNRNYSTLYDGFMIDPIDVKSVSSDDCVVVHADIRVEMTVSLNTIRHVFPHLLRAEYALVKWKLLGARLACLGSSTYVFNSQGRICEMDWAVDLVAALQTVLSLEEITIVLSQARILSGVYFMTT